MAQLPGSPRTESCDTGGSLDRVGNVAYRFSVTVGSHDACSGGSNMPTYEYRCDKCNKHFTVVKSISEHDRRRQSCPKCKSRKVKQVLAPFYAKTIKKS